MIAPVHRFEPEAARLHATYQGFVVAVDDPDGLARVRVRLLGFDGHNTQDAKVWARVAVPFAGQNRGSFLIPDVDDEVLVSFLNGDPRTPVVVGGLWNGAARPPESLGGEGKRVDRWTLVGKQGTRIAIVEEKDGKARIHLTTPKRGPEIVLDQSDAGSIEITAAGTTIRIDSDGVTLNTPGKLTAQASQMELIAGMVDVKSGMSKFSGVVQCDTLITNAVVSSSYTPGAGNIW